LGGIQEGELFALRRSDVDLEGGLIRVRRKRLRLASGQVIEDQLKSRAGVRHVVLPVQAVDELREHLERWDRPEPDDYVFTSPEGMPLERNNFRTRVWLPATAMLGLDGLKFHELRHAVGTLAAQTGATTKELIARLGHSSTRAAMIYQHTSAERDRRIAERLRAMVDQERCGCGTRASSPIRLVGHGWGTTARHRRPDRPPKREKPPLTRAVSRGRNRRRSGDLALFRRALYQLSYPTADLTGFEPASSGLTGRRALQAAPQVPDPPGRSPRGGRCITLAVQRGGHRQVPR